MWWCLAEHIVGKSITILAKKQFWLLLYILMLRCVSSLSVDVVQTRYYLQNVPTCFFTLISFSAIEMSLWAVIKAKMMRDGYTSAKYLCSPPKMGSIHFFTQLFSPVHLPDALRCSTINTRWAKSVCNRQSTCCVRVLGLFSDVTATRDDADHFQAVKILSFQCQHDGCVWHVLVTYSDLLCVCVSTGLYLFTKASPTSSN